MPATTVTISGTVYDEGGDAIPGAVMRCVSKLAVAGQDDGAKVQRGEVATADGSGNVSIDLMPGTYNVTFSFPPNSANTNNLIRAGTGGVPDDGTTTMTLQAFMQEVIATVPGLGGILDGLRTDVDDAKSKTDLIDLDSGKLAFDQVYFDVPDYNPRVAGSHYAYISVHEKTRPIQFLPDGTARVIGENLDSSVYLPDLPACNLRRLFSPSEHIAATLSDRGAVYDVWANVRGGARSTAVMKHASPMWGRIVYGQSTAGQSGDDPDKDPFPGPYYRNCYKPNIPQAYGVEDTAPQATPTIEADQVFELIFSQDNGWVENFPATLAAWAMEYFWRLIEGHATPGQLTATAWEGAQAIASFVNGTSNFANLELYLQKWAALAAKYGRTVESPYIHWMHGENSAASPDYSTALTALMAEVDTVFTAQGMTMPPWVALQVNQNDDNQTVRESRQAVVDLAKVGDLILGGAAYVAPLADNIHANHLGDLIIADMMALAEYRHRAGENTDYLWIDSVATATNTATLTYNIPTHCYALELDRTYTPTVPDEGFVLSDGSGALTITDVSVTANNEITITCDRTISGTLEVVYAVNTMDNTISGWGNGMGNVLCISDMPTVFGGRRMYRGQEVPEHVLQPAASETITS